MAKPLDEVDPVPIGRRFTRSGRRPAPLAERGASTIGIAFSGAGHGKEGDSRLAAKWRQLRAVDLRLGARVGLAVTTWHGTRCGGGRRTISLAGGQLPGHSDRPGESTMKGANILSINRRGAR